MDITILTLGTRGDVQPYVALGLGLIRAGHAVFLATDAGFESFVTNHGLAFAPLHAEFIQLAQSPEGKAAMAGRGRLALMKKVMPMLRRLLDDAWHASYDADAVVYHSKVMAARTSRRSLAFRAIWRWPCRSHRRRLHSRSRLWAAPTSPTWSGPHSPHAPKLYAYSQHVLARPPEWDSDTHVTGYWFLPASADWQPPRELLAFLDGGEPPIYIGFGSMAAQDADATTRAVLDAVRLSGRRAILATGWGGLSTTNGPDNTFLLDSAPHDWLFPRCSAVVHHGGAGTTSAGLRAGKPSVIVPFFGDQPFWARRITALGVGPDPVPARRLNARKLADAMLQATSDAVMRQRAESLAALIGADDGVGNPIDVVVNRR